MSLAVAAILILSSDVTQARDHGGCLPGYTEYHHILRRIVLQGFTEIPRGILTSQQNIVIEIWTGSESRPTWTLIQRQLRSNCARVIGAGVGYFFYIQRNLNGLPL